MEPLPTPSSEVVAGAAVDAVVADTVDRIVAPTRSLSSELFRLSAGTRLAVASPRRAARPSHRMRDARTHLSCDARSGNRHHTIYPRYAHVHDVTRHTGGGVRYIHILRSLKVT